MHDRWINLLSKIISEQECADMRKRIKEVEIRIESDIKSEQEKVDAELAERKEQLRREIMIHWNYNLESLQDSQAKAKDILDFIKTDSFGMNFLNEFTELKSDSLVQYASFQDRDTANDINIDYGGREKTGIEFKNWPSQLEEKLKRIIQETLPPQWSEYGNISSITLIPEQEGFYGYASEGIGTKPTDIEITQNCLAEQNLESTLSHEMAHAASVEALNQMPMEMKVILIDAIIHRLELADKEKNISYEIQDRFNYIEAEYKSNKITKTEANYNKIVEYWAEVCEEYFQNPDSYELYAQDLEIIEWYLWKIDPEFNQQKFTLKLKEQITEKWRGKARLRKMILMGELKSHKGEDDKDLSFIVPPFGKTWEDLGIELS